jgi:hypothetical protein
MIINIGIENNWKYIMICFKYTFLIYIVKKYQTCGSKDVVLKLRSSEMWRRAVCKMGVKISGEHAA